MTSLARFVAGLPKAELHVHHVGSASPRIVADLAARHAGSTPVPADPDLLAEYFVFRDFAHFVEVYLSVVDLVRDPEDMWTLTYEVAQELAGQRVRYAELTVTPYSSIDRGISAEAFCEADRGRRACERRPTSGSVLRWCFDIPGEAGLPSAEVTLDAALRQRPDGLVSFGLGGPEAGVRREQFAPYFAPARAAGLHSVPHAGSRPGPRRYGTRCGISAPSGSGTASRRCATPNCSAISRPTGYHSRCARRPMSALGPCRPLPSTRCRPWSRPGYRYRSTPTIRRCSRPP